MPVCVRWGVDCVYVCVRWGVDCVPVCVRVQWWSVCLCVRVGGVCACMCEGGWSVCLCVRVGGWTVCMSVCECVLLHAFEAIGRLSLCVSLPKWCDSLLFCLCMTNRLQVDMYVHMYVCVYVSPVLFFPERSVS